MKRQIPMQSGLLMINRLFKYLTMKYLYLLLVLLSSTAFYGQKQVLKNKSQVLELSKKITTLLKEEKIADAFLLLEKYWPVSQDQIDGFKEKTIQDFSLIKQKFGPAIGMVKVNEEMIKDFALRETYFIKHKTSPIRIIYSYYKNNEGWVVNNFSWDDVFINEFKSTY